MIIYLSDIGALFYFFCCVGLYADLDSYLEFIQEYD